MPQGPTMQQPESDVKSKFKTQFVELLRLARPDVTNSSHLEFLADGLADVHVNLGLALRAETATERQEGINSPAWR